MRPVEQWIWLPEERYPGNQITRYSERVNNHITGNSFDHSHAWGGTPAYSLPLALSGLEILEPGYRRIRLNPSLLGLDHARVQIPTPYGMIELRMQTGQMPELLIPRGITLEP